MKIIFAGTLLFLSFTAVGQCLTDYKNVYPDRTTSYVENFGTSVSVYDDILAVGDPASDSLGFQSAGLVYLYQRSGGSWKSIGILKPSLPQAQMAFGYLVRVTQHYILVGNGAYNSGIYIFRKPAGGWSTTTETTLLKPSGSYGFGSGFDISADEQTIAVTDLGNPVSYGAFYVFHKQPSDEWTNLAPSQFVSNPEPALGNIQFGIGGIKIMNDRIACATVAGYNSGWVYMFRDVSGAFSNYQYEAKLNSFGATGGYGSNFEFTSEGVFKYVGGSIDFFPAPTSGAWQGGSSTCTFPVGPVNGIPFTLYYVNYQASGNKLYISTRLQDDSGRILILSKLGSDWCSGVSQEVIYTEPAPTPGNSSLFVRSFSVYNQSEIACSWIFPDNAGTSPAVAVGAFTLQADHTWKKQTILKTRTDALNYNLGKAIYRSGDFLFATAINERAIDGQPRGAVYVYKKTGTDWSKIIKLSRPPGNDSDVGFGSFLNGYGDFVAVSGFDYTPSEIFIYQGSNGNFANPILFQTLAMPAGKSVSGYGSPVMNADWIIVPSLRNAAGSLFFFKKDISSGLWLFDSIMDMDAALGNTIYKTPPALDLEGGTLVASNGYDKVYAIEYDSTSRSWKNKYVFAASDPDADSYLGSTINGSLFGTSVKLTDNAIFVGAPGKNYNSTLDVGAIYIFFRNAQDNWVSGNENAKLLPTNKIASTSFGFSLDVLNNTLVTGAVNATSPGKAFVIQSTDYNWKNTVQLSELSGATSGIDYFGYNVALDQNDLFISAHMESNTVGIGAGTVYITTPPSSIRLEPPVCSFRTPFNLSGNPSDGIWSGAGITDVNAGTFDPALAGIGVHTLTYKTPNCFYVGQVQIEVVSSPTGQTIGAMKDTVCAVGKTQVVLAVQPEQKVKYQWYYRTDPSKSYLANTDTTSLITVTSTTPGQYRLEASLLSCIFLHEFEVTKESLQVKIDSIPNICDPTIDTVLLTSNFSGGAWSLSNGDNSSIGQSPPMLSVSQLVKGSYTVNYNYASSVGCLYQSSRSFAVGLLSKPVINSSGDLCSGTLQLTVGNQDKNTTLEWFKDNSAAPFSQTQVIAISSPGDYVVKSKQNACSAISEIAHVNVVRDSLFIPNVITPNGDLLNDQFQVKSENLQSFYLEVVNRYGNKIFNTNDASFKWSADGVSTGTYYWYASYSNCSGK